MLSTSLELVVVALHLLVVVRRVSASASAAVQLRCDGVDDGLDLAELLFQVLGAGAGAVLVNPVGGVLDSLEDGLLILIRELATETLLVTELGLKAIDERRQGVERLDALALSLILRCEALGVGNHAVNLLLGETALLVGDGDRLRLASALVGGANLHDTVGINLEGDLDLGNTAGSGGDTRELEFAEKVVVLGERTFTLEDLDKDSRLVVSGGREANDNVSKESFRTISQDAHLGLPGRDDSVTGNELGEDSTGGLNTKGKRANIDEDDVSGAFSSREDTTLYGSTIGNSLVRVDSLGGFLATEVLLEQLLNLGDTSGTSNEDDLIECD